MGYTTYFCGEIQITPPFNPHEVEYLKRFNKTRRMDRVRGPYFAEPSDNFGQSHEQDVRAYNLPGFGQPGLWCHWAPTEDGTAIVWDEGEKFYDAGEWMRYFIETFVRPNAELQRFLSGEFRSEGSERWLTDPSFEHFTFDHTCNGEIYADGESSDDFWKIVVVDNVVACHDAEIVYADEFVARVAARAECDPALRAELVRRLGT